MGLDIVTNVMAQQASNDLSTNQSNMQNSLEKLSSGYQINTAADDASGLVISQHLQAQIGAFQQAQSNTQSGINVVQTAGGALSEVSTILQRVNTLAVESQNSSAQDPTAQQAAQSEVAQALQSITDIAATTVYGNNTLLVDTGNTFASTVNYTFQTGWDGSKASQVAFSVTALNLANLGLVNNALSITSGATAVGDTVTLPGGVANKGLESVTGTGLAGLGNIVIAQTAAATHAATQTANNGNAIAANTGTVTFTVNGQAYTANIGQGDTVLTDLNNAGAGAVWTSQAGPKFTLTSGTTGTGSTVQITGGTDLADIGGAATALITGTNATYSLQTGTGAAVNIGANDTQETLLDGAGGTLVVSFAKGGQGLTAGNVQGTLTTANVSPTGIIGVTGNVSAGAHTIAVTQASAGASQVGSVAGAVAMTGTTNVLNYEVDGENYSITLNNAADTTTALVAKDINSQNVGGLTASVNPSNELVLTTAAQGSAHTLQVLTGTANAALGFAAAGTTTSNGTDAIVTVDGQSNTVNSLPAGINPITLTGANGTAVQATVNGGLSVGQLGVTQSFANSQLNAVVYSVTSSTAISQVQAAISTVSSMQGAFGAYQNELQDISDNETVGIQNLTASNANIADTNMASQMVRFTQDQVLVQAGVSMLAQANQIPQYVLKLLQ
jgi:flagellin